MTHSRLKTLKLMTRTVQLLFALLLFACWRIAEAGTVLFDPSSINKSVGESFTIDLIGQGFTDDVDGGGVSFTFDPNVVNVTGVAFDPFWDFFTSVGGIDNSAATGGSVSDIVFNTLQSTTQLTPPGAFTIATITFEAMHPGLTGLILSESTLNPFASGGNLLPVDFTNGNFQVNGTVPEPDIWIMLLTGLSFSMRFVNRRRTL